MELLKEHGFNGTGCWSDDELISRGPRRLVYTPTLRFMSGYGKKRGGTYQLTGHTGYPNGCIFVFDPESETFADELAKPLARLRDDSGLANTTGAGWTVATQQEPGWLYQNFTLALLESRGLVGWHWFKYMDNDPEDLSTDPSNRDSNKAIVTTAYEPYRPLLDAMKPLNAAAYPLTAYFDRDE